MMKLLPVTLLLISSAACLADEVVPVYEEPFHRPVATTSTYRVLDVTIPPGKTTLFHTHAEPTLYVTLHRTLVRAQLLRQEWGEAGTPTWSPGDVRYDGSAGEEPFTHRVENLGEENFRLILIASQRKMPNAYPDLLDAMPGEPGLDNEYFVQSRIDLEPGESHPMEGEQYPLILVLSAGADVELISAYADVNPNPSLEKVGDVLGADAGAGALVNRGDEPATIIAVAVR